ncbi:MAG: hypothetical protein Q4B77_03895 [Coriobacteriaceae bacterium]|nr:hypothetical protein [Coriobacteriaceae bacterium]
MDPLQVVLIVLAVAGVWAVVELALMLRRTRGVVDSLDKTVEQVTSTIEEARPVVAKLDGVVDELQPAVAQIEPLLKQATVAVEALSADLVEVNGVLRDVSAVSGAASTASNAVTGIVDGATEKVHKLLGKTRMPEKTLIERASSDQLAAEQAPQEEPVRASEEAACAEEPRHYFTYAASEESGNE